MRTAIQEGKGAQETQQQDNQSIETELDGQLTTDPQSKLIYNNFTDEQEEKPRELVKSEPYHVQQELQYESKEIRYVVRESPVSHLSYFYSKIVSSVMYI